MRTRPRRIAALLLAPLVACSAGADADRRGGAPQAAGELVAPTVATIDGVRTMTHDAAAFDRAPRLEVDPAPVAVLGAPDDDPAYDLTHVSEVALLSDGRFATRSAIGARLLLFGADGRGTRVVGREGQGPGEFTRVESLVWTPGDTLLVFDGANGRLTHLHADGAVRATPVPMDTLLFYGSLLPRALPDGRVAALVQTSRRTGELGTVWRPPYLLALFEPDAGTIGVIGSIPGWETATVELRRRGRRRPVGVNLRLGRSSHAAVLDSAIVTGIGDGYTIDFRAPDASVVARLRVDRPRRLVTQPMREAVIARELALIDVPGSERRIDANEDRRHARENPFADSLPPYSAILTSRDGTLWVVDAIAPTDTAWSATAFRADGAIVGRLHVAGGGRPMAFEGDRVAVRQEDADGIVTVRVHRIRPARAGS